MNKHLLKYIVIFYSILNSVIGFALVLLSVAFVSAGYIYMQPTEKTALLYELSFATIVIGILTAISGILGVLGAVARSQCLLALTALLLLIPLSASIYISYEDTEPLKHSIHDQLEEIFQDNYGVDEDITTAVNLLQSHLKCCGVDSPSDWADAFYNSKNMTRSEEDPSMTEDDYLVPDSCCRQKRGCQRRRKILRANNYTIFKRIIFSKGCATLMDNHVSMVLEKSEVILMSDATLDVFAIVFIWILFFVIRHEKPRNLEDLTQGINV